MLFLKACFMALLVFALGLTLRLAPPRYRRGLLGYRTPFAKKNCRIWKSAQRCFAIRLLQAALLSVAVDIVLNLMGMDNYTVYNLIAACLAVASFPLTELHLRLSFGDDEDSGA